MTFLSAATIGAMVLAFVVYLRVRQARTLVRLASQIRALRGAAEEDPTHHPVGADDPRSPAALPLYQEFSRELGEQGYQVLGELVERSKAGKTAGVARWFVAPDGQTCGWFAALATEKGLSPVRFLFSESLTPGVYFITYSGASSVRVVHPASIQRAELPIEQGLAAALTRHRELIAASTDAESGLRSVVTLDDAVGLLHRLRAESRRWRATQPADQLLEADLRQILGARYALLAPRLGGMLQG